MLFVEKTFFRPLVRFLSHEKLIQPAVLSHERIFIYFLTLF